MHHRHKIKEMGLCCLVPIHMQKVCTYCSLLNFLYSQPPIFIICKCSTQYTYVHRWYERGHFHRDQWVSDQLVFWKLKLLILPSLDFCLVNNSSVIPSPPFLLVAPKNFLWKSVNCTDSHKRTRFISKHDRPV